MIEEFPIIPPTSLTTTSSLHFPNARISPEQVASQRELAAYLMARASSGRPIADDDVARLALANDTVRLTRQNLSLGRSNVAEDISASRRQSLHAGRAKREEEYVLQHRSRDYREYPFLHGVALALESRAGFCGEHSHVSAAFHSALLRTTSPRFAGETLHILTHRIKCHQWTESRIDGKASTAVVLDPWHEGAPCLTADGRKTRRGLTRVVDGSAKQGFPGYTYDDIQSARSFVKSRLPEPLDDPYANARRYARGEDISPKLVYRSKSILHPGVARRFRTSLRARPFNDQLALAKAAALRLGWDAQTADREARNIVESAQRIGIGGHTATQRSAVRQP